MVTTMAERAEERSLQVPHTSSLVRRVGRLAFGLALAGLSALLGTWAFPPYGAWPLIFVAWVPMLVAQHWILSRRWAWVAVGIGIGGYYAGYLRGVIDPSFAWWVLCIPIVVAVAAGLGAIRDRPRQEATGYVHFVLGFPLLWTAAEFLRGFAPGSGTQGYVAYALFREPWLLQPVSVLGINVLNLLILVVNWTIALGVLACLQRRRPRTPKPFSGRVVAVSGLLCALAGGTWLGASLLMFQPDPAKVVVAAMQPGIHTPGAIDLSRDIAQTRVAASEGARLVVWQEGTLGADPHHTPIGAELSQLARQSHVYLVVGYRFVTARGQHNDATVISPSGTYLGVYGKQHPALMFADDQTSVDAGTMPVYQTPFGRVATMICFDADYTDTARSAARHGAQILAVPSQDPPGDASKHYGLLVFRAIENRLTIVKGEFSYDSLVIDPYGRILASAITPQGARASVVARVPVGSGSTPLVVLGDLWGWLLVAGAVLMMVLVHVKTRRHQRSGAVVADR